MALSIYTVFALAILIVNVNGQCGGEKATEQCGCSNPTTTTQRTIEIIRVREPENRPSPETEYPQRPAPVVLRPTIQKYFVFPQNSGVRYPTPYPQGNGGYYMMPIAVRRKVIKKSTTEKPN